MTNTDQGQWWYFTFGKGQEHEGHYVKIWGDYLEARQEMISRYGMSWAFQYSQAFWESLEAGRDQLPYELETELVEN